jgi:hypothetical protein
VPPAVASSPEKDVSLGKEQGVAPGSLQVAPFEARNRLRRKTAPSNGNADVHLVATDATQPGGEGEQGQRAEYDGEAEVAADPKTVEAASPFGANDDEDPLLPGQNQSTPSDTTSTKRGSEEERSDTSSEEEEDNDDDDDEDEDGQRGQPNKPSGKFAEAGTGLLNSLLRRVAAKKNNAGDGASPDVEEEEEGNEGGREGAAANHVKASKLASGGYQWQKSHINYNQKALVKLTRLLVKDAINVDRTAKGLEELSAGNQLYKSTNRPDWWPLEEFGGMAFKKKDDAIKVYNAARKVMAAVRGVELDMCGVLDA